jgi:hypothetical protein
MYIYIKPFSANPETQFLCSEDDKLSDIMKQFYLEQGMEKIDRSMVRVLLAGRDQDISKTLKELCIDNNTTLQCVLRLLSCKGNCSN